jgi:hypothetical protein
MLRRVVLVRTDVSEELLHQGDKNRWTRNNVSRDKQPTHATKKCSVASYG